MSELEKHNLKIFNNLKQNFKNKPAGSNDGVVYGIVKLKYYDVVWMEYYAEHNSIAAYKIFNSDGTINRTGYLEETHFVSNYLDGMKQDGEIKTWTVYENEADVLVDKKR
jgi:hypothetical protein